MDLGVAARSATTTGPLINGEETLIALLSPFEFENYPHLDAPWALINKGFSVTHVPYFSPELERFAKSTYILSELGSRFFTYVVFSKKPGASGKANPYATAYARDIPGIYGE